MMYN